MFSTDKRRLLIESEFSSMLTIMSRKGNSLSGVIRQAWDNGDLSTLTGNNPQKVTGAHVSITGHTTQEELLQNLKYAEVFNGFANRFLWISVSRSKCLPNPKPLPDKVRFWGTIAWNSGGANTPSFRPNRPPTRHGTIKFPQIFRFRPIRYVLWDGIFGLNRIKSPDFGRLAQRQSIGLTHRGSQVQILHRPPFTPTYVSRYSQNHRVSMGFGFQACFIISPTSKRKTVIWIGMVCINPLCQQSKHIFYPQNQSE